MRPETTNDFPSFVRVLIRHNNLFLVIKECKKEYNNWNFVGGKIEADEDIETAAVREVKEEVNLDIVNLTFLNYDIFTYSIGTWNGYYFVADVTNPASICINEPDKCRGYCWMTQDEIIPLEPFGGHKKIFNFIPK